MNEELDQRIAEEDRLGTRFITRYGVPSIKANLEKVTVRKASSIIILSPENRSPASADAEVLRIVIVLGNLLTSRNTSHLVAEVNDEDNAVLLKMVCGERLECIISHSIIGRLMVIIAYC